jgi:hypothetical protein
MIPFAVSSDRGYPMASHKELKARQRRERHTHSPSVALRVHRALSWLGRAEKERADDDARFVFLWIAFNAAYATESHDSEMTEKRSFKSFLRTLMKLDTRGHLGYLIWREFPNSIRVLLKNEFVFTDFWQHHNERLTAAEWESRFKKSRRAAELALAGGDTLQVLSIVLARLYVLRNQLIHGGATWNGSVNRDQVRDCANLLGKLVPIVIEIMMDHPAHDWGAATYPVIERSS